MPDLPVDGRFDLVVALRGVVNHLPPAVLDEATERVGQGDVSAEIEAELDERRDLRDLTAWTTDPADAQDFDDATVAKALRRRGLDVEAHDGFGPGDDRTVFVGSG